MFFEDLKGDVAHYLMSTQETGGIVDPGLLPPVVADYLERQIVLRNHPVLPDGRQGYLPSDVMSAFPARQPLSGKEARDALEHDLKKWSVNEMYAENIRSLSAVDAQSVDRMRHAVNVNFDTDRDRGAIINNRNNAFNGKSVGQLLIDGRMDAVHHVARFFAKGGEESFHHRLELERISSGV